MERGAIIKGGKMIEGFRVGKMGEGEGWQKWVIVKGGKKEGLRVEKMEVMGGENGERLIVG